MSACEPLDEPASATLSVFDAARDAPDALALVDAHGALSYRELAVEVDRRRLGLSVRPGEAVCVEAAPVRSRVIDVLTTWAGGGFVVPLGARWTDGARAAARAAVAGLVAPALAAVVRTSGSAGEPRHAALTTDAFVAAAAASAARLGWETRDAWRLELDFAHIGGLSVLARCLLARRAVILGATPARATLASMVPTQLFRLVSTGAVAPRSLRAVLVGGASCPPALVRSARALGWPVRLTYGLTETCAQVATQRPGDSDGTVGPPLDGQEIRIVDGALEVRSRSLLTGWARAGVLAPAVGPDGFFRTHDLAELQGDCLRILGRADAAILTGGHKVHPVEVEAALFAQLAAPACVFGVPDPEWGERVVVVFEGVSVARAREAIGRADLPAYARPRQVACVDALPRLAGLKVDRRALGDSPLDWVD